MGISNLNNVHLSVAEVDAAKSAVEALENALSTINVSLSSNERQQYGSINEQNKLLVNKVNDFHKNQSQLDAPEVDWNEFEKDYASRLLMENLINRLTSLVTRLENAKILYDYDNYQASLTDYAFTSYKAGAGGAGFETKMGELKQFFVRPASKEKPSEPKA